MSFESDTGEDDEDGEEDNGYKGGDDSSTAFQTEVTKLLANGEPVRVLVPIVC